MTADTDHFRAELLEHQERLTSTLAQHDLSAASQTEETGELTSSSNDNHLADAASETYERELEEGLEEDTQAQLRDVEDALGRIEAGTYGVCEVCGKAIPKERLEAVPWTKLCIDDARKLGR